MNKKVIQKLEDTQALSVDFAHEIHPGQKVYLIGKLGAGKTTFVRFLAAALGFTDKVKSPTFTYVREYWHPHKQLKLCHVDLYRLEDGGVENLGLENYFADPDTICLVEWADRALEELPAADFVIKFEVLDNERREIGIKRKT